MINFTKHFNTIKDIATKRTRFIEFFTILLMFLAIGFSFKNTETTWFWSCMPFMAAGLIIFALVLVRLRINEDYSKHQEAIKEIEGKFENKTNKLKDKVNNLSLRQFEIFELIAQGKSNKEITDSLCIELSTLKTHINHMYKILNISSRKEARVIAKKIQQF